MQVQAAVALSCTEQVVLYLAHPISSRGPDKNLERVLASLYQLLFAFILLLQA